MRELPIHVLIVDDHPMVRTGLVRVLELYDELEVVGEATSGEEALSFCATTTPDVVLVDVKLPGMDGLETIRLLKQRHPKVQAAVLTSYEDGHTVMGAVQAG